MLKELDEIQKEAVLVTEEPVLMDSEPSWSPTREIGVSWGTGSLASLHESEFLCLITKLKSITFKNNIQIGVQILKR